MGFFDKMTESAFKEGINGETIYFPNGVLGKGRLVQESARKEQLFKFHKRLNKYLIPVSILYGILAGLTGEVSLTGFMPLIILGIIVFLRQRFLMRGLPIHDEKLTVKEASTYAAKAFHPVFLFLIVLNGIILLLLSFALPFILEKPIDEVFFLMLFPFAIGLMSLGIGLYLYKVK